MRYQERSFQIKTMASRMRFLISSGLFHNTLTTRPRSTSGSNPAQPFKSNFSADHPALSPACSAFAFRTFLISASIIPFVTNHRSRLISHV
jgi:hypothetical protein